jgi:carbon starvation protein CstA
VVDPYGGIWTMWPLFGATNQMLAAIALMLCTVVLYKMKRERWAWVTVVPTVWLVVCTVTAGLEKVFSPNPKVGFLSHAEKFSQALASQQVLAPAKSLHEMSRVIFNDYLDAALAALAVAIVIVVVVYGIVSIRRARATPRNTAIEIGEVAMGHG